MAAMAPESLQFIVNHVILPPKLPQEAENPHISRTAECHLVDLLSTQLKSYRREIDLKSSSLCAAWAINQAMLHRCASLISTPSLDAETVVRAFASLDETGEWRDVVPNRLVLKNSQKNLRSSQYTSEPRMPSSSYAKESSPLYLSVSRPHP